MGKRTQPRGCCFFCGAESVTKEHIWAKSLTKLFEGHGTIRHEYAHPEDGVETKVKRANTFAIYSRKVCRSCNGGWMRAADEAARPMLAACAQGHSFSLDAEEQEQLAFWATKTVLALLTVEPEEYRFARPEHYREVFESRAPLTGSQVWLGGNEHGHVAWARAHALNLGGELEDSHGFGASLSFGYGVLHLMYHGSDDYRLRLRFQAHQSLKQIWPTQESIEWPPRLLMRPADLTPLPKVINANSAWVPVEPVNPG